MAAVLAIEAEVAVEGQHGAFRVEFAHADQTGVGHLPGSFVGGGHGVTSLPYHGRIPWGLQVWCAKPQAAVCETCIH